MKNHIFSIILTMVSFSLTYLSYLNGKNFYEDRIKNNKIRPKIYDVFHKYLPDNSHNSKMHYLTNIFVFFPLIFNLSIIDDYLSYMMPIFLFRYITTNATILPKTKECDDKDFTILNFFNGHCYDKIFSGHMSSSIIISLLLYEKKIITDIRILYLYNIISAYLILVTRSHYTVDILIAIYVSVTSYMIGLNSNFIKDLF
jgi:hypothetical protein